MKKVLLLAVIFIITGLSQLNAQRRHPHFNPIPSYNCPVNNDVAAFKEKLSHGTPGREKRDMDVVISSSSSSPLIVFAQVWVVKEGGAVVLGPFTTFPDETLSVPIDDGIWGVVINCDWNITASVWIE